MKRKGVRSIPDFSSKKKGPSSSAVDAPARTAMPVVMKDRNVKPQATSSKSGRRGQ